MFEKMKLLGPLLILIGAATLFPDNNVLFNSSYISYGLIFLGIILLLAAWIFTNNHKSLLCRVGFHKYKHMGWDEEMPVMAIHKCERCGYIRKVVRSG